MRRVVLTECLVVIAAVVLVGQEADGGVSTFTIESDFFAAVDIESTETFDGYGPSQVMGVGTCQVGQVIYTASDPTSQWRTDSSSTIRMLGTPSAIDDWDALTFRPGKYTTAIGFGIRMTALYHPLLIDVLTTDGQTHTQQVLATGGMKYHGFVAAEGEGIISATIRDLPGDGGMTNFFFDDVSHGAIAPEPATMSFLALGGLAMLRRRRQ